MCDLTNPRLPISDRQLPTPEPAMPDTPELTPDTSHLTPKPRGGRRPGAGAPRGNLNALKHGRRSRQFAAIGAILSADPTVRDSLLALARRHDDKNARAQEVAGDLLARLIIHAREVAHGKTSPGPFAGIARLNIVRKALSDAQSTKTTKLAKKK